MNAQLKQILWNQFGAALDTLRSAIEMCPESVWSNPANWTETGEQKTFDNYKPEFWYWAYHDLFWTDYYLSNQKEADFQPPAPFDKGEFDDRGVIPPRVYTKEELLTYLEYCRSKLRTLINTMTEQSAMAPCQSDFRPDYPYLEIFLYNMRHVQHHSAQLIMLLRQRINDAPRWVSRTKHQLDQ